MIEVTLERNALLNPLQGVIGAIERRQTMPMLANVLVEASDNAINLTATDLEITLQASAVATVNQAGRAALPARKLFEICKNLPDGAQVSIDAGDEKAIVKSGKSRFTLTCLPADDFPSPQAIDGAAQHFSIPLEGFSGLIARTAFCMAHQDVRYYLNGLMLEPNPHLLRAVATDGHRLAYAELPVELDIDDPQQVIIPKKGVSELQRLLSEQDGELSITLSSNMIRIEAGSRTMISKLIDGRFPDYNRVIPEEAANLATVDRVAFREALQRAAILSNEKYRGIRLEFSSDSLTLQAHNSENEEAQEEIPIEYDGDPLQVGFNVQYLMDVCNTSQNDVLEISIQDPNSSALLLDPSKPGTRYVVMPMRL